MRKLKHLTYIAGKYLFVHERIKRVILGAYGNVNNGSHVKSGLVVATDHRVLFCEGSLFWNLSNCDSVSLADISSIEMSESYSNLSQLRRPD